MIWSQIGSKPTSQIIEMGELIELWRIIYKGKQEWLNYSYPTLTGTKQTRRRKTINAAKLVCNEFTKLIWGEDPTLILDDAMLKVYNDSRLSIVLPDFTERILAQGGGALKLYVEDNEMYIDLIPAIRFIPVSWKNGYICEADFIDKQVKGKDVFIRVESHRKQGTGQLIKNTVYKKVDEEYKIVNVHEFDESMDEEVFIDVSYPLFSYVRNIGDNNLIDGECPLGLSTFANSIDTLEALDIAFDALNQEVVLGRKRIIVPAGATRYVTDPDTGKRSRYFDPTDEVFQAFDSEDKINLTISDNSVELRIDEIKQAIATLLSVLAVQVGFSVGHLKFEDGGIKTATEVISENSKTFKTKVNIENNIKRGLLEIFNAAREVAKVGQIPVTDEEYNIVFQDNIIEDKASKTKYWNDRYIAKTCTLEDVLINVDGLSEEEAKIKADVIKKSNADADIDDIFGIDKDDKE